MFRDLTTASAALAALIAPLFVALLLLPADQSEAQTGTPSLSVADIRKITTGYRAAARNIARKEAFVIESLRRYPGATTTLNVLIGRELQPQILSYTNDLKKEATRAFASRLAKFGRVKVQQLQMQVNALREDPNLTKDLGRFAETAREAARPVTARAALGHDAGSGHGAVCAKARIEGEGNPDFRLTDAAERDQNLAFESAPIEESRTRRVRSGRRAQ